MALNGRNTLVEALAAAGGGGRDPAPNKGLAVNKKKPAPTHKEKKIGAPPPPKAEPVPDANGFLPDEVIRFRDPRTVVAATGAKINPNRDLKNGAYPKWAIRDLTRAARATGEDPYTMIAMSLQENSLGIDDDNLGHVLYGYIYADPKLKAQYEQLTAQHPNVNDQALAMAFWMKHKRAKALEKGYQDEAMQLQYYNGTGALTTGTEYDYHTDEGKSTKRFYGVDVTKKALDMKKNPMYGKTVLDLRENVIRQNPELLRYIDETSQEYEAEKNQWSALPIPSNQLRNMSFKNTKLPEKG